VLDVAALGFEVRLVRGARAGAHVEIAGCVDDDLCKDRAASLLALEKDAAQLAPVEDRRDHPRVQEEPHARLEQEVGGDDLEPFRIDHGRPGDRVSERAQALAPVADRIVIGRAPELRRGAGDGVFRQALEDLGREPADDLTAFPVGHAVDPDDEPPGR
jgi:hypothetical protein